LWMANQYRLGSASKTYCKLHAEYDSDVVRIGPNTVSIRNVDAVEKIYKGKYPRSSLSETGWLNGDHNMNTIRDYKIQPIWRRIWEKAFTTREINEYTPRVETHASRLIGILNAAKKAPVNAAKVIDNFVFDVMADICFSNDGGLQDGTGDTSYMDGIHAFVMSLSVIGNLRNLCQLVPYIPATPTVKTFRAKNAAMLAARQKLGTTKKDMFTHLLAEDSETGCVFTQTQLNANANFIIPAGSDTTSSSIAQTLRALCKNRPMLKRLQAEVDEACDADGDLTIDNTKNLKYLGGVVNEALRILNPVSSGIPAMTRPQGVKINGIFIPGNVQVWVPHLALMTDERYFPKGNEFIPERWLEEMSDLIKDKKAYIPFGYGVHSCLGKQLALNEMRLVIAKIVRNFDLEFGEQYDDQKFLRELKDHLVMAIGELNMVFIPRGR